MQFILGGYFFIVGTIVGSFLNVVIDRLTFGKSILGRSHCDHCKKQLAWFNLIPVVSFIWQKGTSTCCNKTKLSYWYPVTELLTGVIFVYIVLLPVDIVTKALGLIIASCVIVIVISDTKYQLISDEVQLVLFVCLCTFILYTNGLNSSVINNIIGALIVPLPLLAIYLFSKGKAMGFADVKLAASIGVILGAPLGFIGLYLGFILGAIFGVMFIISKNKNLRSEMAFGPFLIFGTLITYIYQLQIMRFVNNYITLFSK
jgi:prepilin signal peptidase PulO-like enzyme (type II secretory pathway)